MPTERDDATRAQQAAWARGDFHRIGVSQVVVGESLVRALHVHAGERVLDVAGGSGNTALAAARRSADVICTDYVPGLLEHAERRAAAEGLPLRTEVADAQALPFADGSFDVVTSTFGAMFAPDQRATASELTRVLRLGGRVGLANWTPDGWVGGQLRLQATYLPPPPGVPAPTLWGTRDRVADLLGDPVDRLEITEEYADFVHVNTTSLFELFTHWFGPMVTVMSRLDAERAAAFREEWIELADRHNVATDGTCEIPSPYLQVVAVKRG